MEMRIILFGATGDLAKAKILPAFDAIGVTPLLYGRKEIQAPYYIQGELNEIHQKLKDKNITHAYVSLPPVFYEGVLQELAQLPDISRIALEKPFGTSSAHAQELISLIASLNLEDKVYLVDHYLGKPALINVLNLSTDERKMHFDENTIARITIDAFETNTVAHRGAFYDSVGTIKDFVQNHIMAIIATLLMQQGCEALSTLCRQRVLEKISFKEHSLVTGQYEGFKESPGVNPDSDTETYVAVDFIYDNKIEIKVRVGKAMHEAKTEAVLIYKDGSRKEINIQSKTNSYEAILRDFIGNQARYALSYAESQLCWKITEDVLKAKKGIIPIIYPQGSNPDVII